MPLSILSPLSISFKTFLNEKTHLLKRPLKILKEFKIVLGKFVIYEMTYFTFHFSKEQKDRKKERALHFFFQVWMTFEAGNLTGPNQNILLPDQKLLPRVETINNRLIFWCDSVVVFLSFCLFVFLSFCLFVFLSFCLFVFLSFCLLSVSFYSGIMMFCLSVSCLSLPICLSVYLYVTLSFCLSVCLLFSQCILFNFPIQQPQQQHQQRRSRAGRVRTVLTEKQLQLLKSCYNANPRPDALMKEQLVEMTGLSPRVIRVWFQNKRCKDKKKMQMKQSKVTGFNLVSMCILWSKHIWGL